MVTEAHSSPTMEATHENETKTGIDSIELPDRRLEVQPAAPSSFPDGGLRAWMSVLGGFCSCFSSYGWISSIGVFQTYYQDVKLKSYSPSEVSWIVSVQVFTLTVLAPVNGKIFDSYGCRALIIVGTILHVFGLMMTSISTEYYQIFLAQSICSGFGVACLYHGAINAVSTWFQKRRGLALGLVSSGASIGGVVIPIMFDRLVNPIGFGWTMRVIAFMFLGVQIVAILTVRSRLQHVPQSVDLREFARPFRETTFLFNALACFFTFWGILIPFNYITLTATASGMSPRLAGYLIPLINGVSFIGRIFPPWAGDHLGRFNAAILFTLIGAILALALWIPASTHANAPSIVFAALFGLPLGCFASLLPALVAQISDVRHIGVRLGATFFITAFAGLTGNPIAGALIDRGLSLGGAEEYLYLKIFCGVTIAVGAAFFVLARISQGPAASKT